MKIYHLDDQEMNTLKFDVELVTSSEMTAKAHIIVKNKHSYLIN